MVSKNLNSLAFHNTCQNNTEKNLVMKQQFEKLKRVSGRPEYMDQNARIQFHGKTNVYKKNFFGDIISFLTCLKSIEI